GGVLIRLGVQQMAAVRATNVHVDHGGASVQTFFRSISQGFGRQRYGGMLFVCLVGAARRDGKNQGSHFNSHEAFLGHASSASCTGGSSCLSGAGPDSTRFW